MDDGQSHGLPGCCGMNWTEADKRDDPKGWANHLIAALTVALQPDEFWCVAHPDGVLPETRAKDLATPVKTICDALDCDWDDLTEQGYRLTRCFSPT